MTNTWIDIDDVALERARELSGLPTTKEIVNSGLQTYMRRMELDRYTEFVTGGALDDLGDLTVTERAQR